MCPNNITIEKIQKFDRSRYRDPAYVLQEEATKGARGGVSEHNTLIKQREEGLKLENYLETDDLINRLTTLEANIDAYNKDFKDKSDQNHILCENYNKTTPCKGNKKRISCEEIDECEACYNDNKNNYIYDSNKNLINTIKYFIENDYKRRPIPITTLLKSQDGIKCGLNRDSETVKTINNKQVKIAAGYFNNKNEAERIRLCKNIVRIDSSGKTISLAEDCPYGCKICL